MNHIEMYASTSLLKQGLHRVLAVSHALATPLRDGEARAWWDLLDPADQELGRQHRLSLERLAAVYATQMVRDVLDAGFAAVGLAALDHDAVAGQFRAAVISGKAHRAHLGRDVYGASNKGLWDVVCGPFGAAVAERFGPALGETALSAPAGQPSSEALDALRALTAFDTSPRGADHKACVAWLSDRLVSLGFTVETLGRDLGKPLVAARRPPRGLAGHVVLYGHYDVTPHGRESRWAHPPRELTLADGRLHARGVADNKGPLACRLAALAELDATPELTWLIQGEEETGSRVAHALLPDLVSGLSPTLWLDETGYHDHEDGTLRLLGRTVADEDASEPPDPALSQLLQALGGLATRWGLAARHKCRGLNKSVVPGGCPFNRSLPRGARYVAVGVNDSAARIHGTNESLPAWTFPLHAAQLDVLFRWADHTHRSEA